MYESPEKRVEGFVASFEEPAAAYFPLEMLLSCWVVFFVAMPSSFFPSVSQVLMNKVFNGSVPLLFRRIGNQTAPPHFN